MTEVRPASSGVLDVPNPTPGERLRHAAYLLRKGAPIQVESDRLRSVLAAVLDQEATWADDRGDRYPATTAAVLAVADAVNHA